MPVILKPKETIVVEIGEVKFYLSPLTWRARAEISSLAVTNGGDVKSNMPLMTALTIKHGLKKVIGVKRIDGTDYELSFDENGILKDQCIDDLLDIEHFGDQLLIAGIQLFSRSLKDGSIPGAIVYVNAADEPKKN